VRPSPAPWHDQIALNSIAWSGVDNSHSQPSNVDTLSAQAVRVVSNEMLLNRKIKKSGWRSRRDATTSFLYNCQGKATGTWQAVPLVSSPSSCCASNLPQAGSVDQADNKQNRRLINLFFSLGSCATSASIPDSIYARGQSARCRIDCTYFYCRGLGAWRAPHADPSRG
jgi:hypothetical protein